ncbi:MAG TPA: hypothetical protein HA256_07635 [Methanoregulaceae archaeon]|jgi:thiamine biosynthesis protein ThiC|nr:hypothetical protein [Methanoregulaceae archaeon]
MDTRIRYAENGKITHQMKTVSCAEGIDPEIIAEQIAVGRIVIMQRGGRMTGIGAGLAGKSRNSIHDTMKKMSCRKHRACVRGIIKLEECEVR